MGSVGARASADRGDDGIVSLINIGFTPIADKYPDLYVDFLSASKVAARKKGSNGDVYLSEWEVAVATPFAKVPAIFFFV